MATVPIVDISAGDPTPELSTASLIDTVKVVNRFGHNIEIPAANVAGPVVVRRNLTIAAAAVTTVPGQLDGYGTNLSVSHGSVRSTILQQSVNTNDERLYLLNNASAQPGGVFTNGFVYDKTGAAASTYLQMSGAHIFFTAPIGNANSSISFTQNARIDSNGMTIDGALMVTKNASTNVAIAAFLNNANGTKLEIASVKDANAYIQGSVLSDCAIRVESGNLAIGALAGNTTIGSSTRTNARFNANGTVIIHGNNAPTSTYGGVAIGSGLTLVVGNGSNSPADTKALWFYQDNAPSFIGGGMQFNAQQGFDFWVGNTTTAWLRNLQLQKSGKVLIGGVQSATAIGDLHINQIGADLSASLSLTGASTASYILLGNRDSGGTAGPSIIASSNRQIQFGVGDSYSQRTGGTFTQYAVISGGSFGIGISAPENYDKLVVDIHGTTTVTQLFRTFVSPASGNTNGNLAGGYGIHWGNVFIGHRAVHGGDADNAALAVVIASGGASVEAARFDTSRNLTVRGSTINLGSSATNVLSCDASNQTYLRGSAIALQSTSAVNYLTASSTGITLVADTTANGNLIVNGTIIAHRQIETTTDKSLSSGIITFDYNTNATWMCANQTSNFTANFTNISIEVGRVQTCTLILQQGSPAYGPNAVQINGVNVPVKWAGGMAPVWTPSNVDVCVFSLIRTTSNTWIVLASVTPYV